MMNLKYPHKTSKILTATNFGFPGFIVMKLENKRRKYRARKYQYTQNR